MAEQKQTYTITVTTGSDRLYDIRGATAYLVDDRGDLTIRHRGRTHVFAHGYWLVFIVIDEEPAQA